MSMKAGVLECLDTLRPIVSYNGNLYINEFSFLGF